MAAFEVYVLFENLNVTGKYITNLYSELMWQAKT